MKAATLLTILPTLTTVTASSWFTTPEPLSHLLSSRSNNDNNDHDNILHPRASSIPYACSKADMVLKHQLATISHLQNASIRVPPFLAVYFSTISEGREMIGCTEASSSTLKGKRDADSNDDANEFEIEIESEDQNEKRTVNKMTYRQPCSVIDEQYDATMTRVESFLKNDIVVPPFIAGRLSAEVDGNRGLGCEPFGRGTAEASVVTGSVAEATDSAQTGETDSTSPE